MSDKKHMHIGLKLKFMGIMGTLLLILVLGSVLFIIRYNNQQFTNNQNNQSKAFSTLATSPIGDNYMIYKDSGTLKIDEQVERLISLEKSVTAVAIVNISGDRVYTSGDFALEIPKSSAGAFESTITKSASGVTSMIVVPYFDNFGAHQYSIAYSFSDTYIKEIINTQTRTAIALGLVLLALSFVLFFVIINYFILSPVAKLSEHAKLIALGDFSHDIQISGHDEIAELGESVKKMSISLRGSIEGLKEVDRAKSEFMRIASHNIRTPLTIINGYLEISQKETDLAKIKQILSNINIGTKRLGVFAEDVLEISRIELGGDKIEAAVQDITPIVNSITTDFDSFASLKNIRFNYVFDQLVRNSRIPKPHLRSAVWNLLDNALKFTDSGGSVSLNLSENDENYFIDISDSGVGIQPDEMPKLFTKFHRGTSVINYDYDGSGLGLYATKLFINQMSGDIGVSSTPGKGSVFRISLPKA